MRYATVALLVFGLAGSGDCATRAELVEKIRVLGVELSSASARLNTLAVSQDALIDTFRLTNAGDVSMIVAGVKGGTANADVDIPVALLRGPYRPSAVQFEMVLPSSFTFVSATAGPAAIASNKQIVTSVVGNVVRVVIFGLNQFVITSGVLCTVRLHAGAIQGKTHRILLQNPVSSNPEGQDQLITYTAGMVVIP